MTNIQRHIQFLVATSDCVIIPGWGALIACSSPAYVDEYRFMPPSRTLVFNPALTHDDGMLASSLTRREGISFATARAEIAAEVAAMRATYESCGSVSIPRVGLFRRLPDSTMSFEADPNGIAGARYLALPQVVLSDSGLNNLPTNNPDTDIHIMPRESLGKRVLRVAAFVAILLGLALTLSTPISVNLGRSADFAAVGGSPLHRQNDIAKEPVNVQLVLSVPDSAISVVPTASRPAPRKSEEPRYYLIIGSLESRSRAERWMAGHTDVAKGIVVGNGHYRVYAGTGNSIEEAFERKSDPEFARRYPDAWVYRRH